MVEEAGAVAEDMHMRTMTLRASLVVLILSAPHVAASCGRTELPQRTFQAPEEAVRALEQVVRTGDAAELARLFGPDAQALIDSSEPDVARQRRDVFAAAMAQGWRLVNQGDSKVLVVGDEVWPFPVPLTQNAFGWRFDTGAGKEEILARRIGRNELAVIDICRRYVAAQQAYASHSRDGLPAGLYAQKIRSDPGRQNGLFWPAARGERRSPLGDLIAEAADRPSSSAGRGPTPFHGYYFRILTAQGPAAERGARTYIVDGAMSGGFALVAWPAQYDVTGIMTFLVNQTGVVHEKDLGRRTATAIEQITAYNPDPSWQPLQ